MVRHLPSNVSLIARIIAAGALVLSLAATSTVAVADTSGADASTQTPAANLNVPLEAPAVGDKRPNVVVVLVDDMRTDDLAHMPKTRALLSTRGMTFTNAVSPHPLCCPARAELMTGQFAQNNGVQHNSSRYGGWHRLDSTNTVATWFTHHGYHTGFIGKYLNGYDLSNAPEPGWNVWDSISQGVTDYFNFTFHDGTTYTADYVTNRIEERTNDAVRTLSSADRPFLIYSNHLAPHDRQVNGEGGLTFAPAEPKFARYAASAKAPSISDKTFNTPVKNGLPSLMRMQTSRSGFFARHGAGYYQAKFEARINSLASVDESVESLFKTLTETNEADNTYVVFTSDNGYSLGEHKLYRKNILTSQVLSIPLMVTGPGIIPGSTSHLPVTLVDLVATIADLSTVTPDLLVDGTSFAPTLRGGTQWWRDTTLIQTGSEDVHGPNPGWGMRGVRTDRYTFAKDVNTGERLLFDHARDVQERVNLVTSTRYRRVVGTLNRRTNHLVNCAGTACNRTFGHEPRPEG